MFTGSVLHFAGHSLGAGVAVLVALKLRPRYPHLKVYAFSTPGKILHLLPGDNISSHQCSITWRNIFGVSTHLLITGSLEGLVESDSVLGNELGY